jgi:hypothetical protein
MKRRGSGAVGVYTRAAHHSSRMKGPSCCEASTMSSVHCPHTCGGHWTVRQWTLDRRGLWGVHPDGRTAQLTDVHTRLRKTFSRRWDCDGGMSQATDWNAPLEKKAEHKGGKGDGKAGIGGAAFNLSNAVRGRRAPP